MTETLNVCRLTEYLCSHSVNILKLANVTSASGYALLVLAFRDRTIALQNTQFSGVQHFSTVVIMLQQI